MKLLGSRIADARKRRGMTQRELAEATGVSVQAVSQWENGKTDASQRASNLATLLNCDIKYLTGEIEIEPAQPLFELSRFHLYIAPLMDIDDLPEHLTLFGGKFEPAAYQHIDSTIEPIGKLFAAFVKSDSAYFNKGDILIFDTGLEPISGDLCAVIILSDQIHLMPVSNLRQRLGGAIGDIARKTAGDNAPLIPLMNSERSSASTLVVGTMVEHRTFRSGRPTA